MTPERLNLNNIQCVRCGNCCPALDCGYFERNQGITTCTDHPNNNKRVGCSLPPIYHYNAGIACRAIENELKKIGRFTPRNVSTVPSGQIYYTDSELYKRITKIW